MNRHDVTSIFHRRLTALIPGALERVRRIEDSLYVYVGEPIPKRLAEIAGQTPKNALLLYLFPKFEPNLISPIFDSEFHSDLIFVEILDDQFWNNDIISLLVNCLRFKKVIYASSASLAGSIILERLRLNADEALMNANHERLSRLVKFRCALRNMPLAINQLKAHVDFPETSPPAVICGAGPSLLDYIDQLKENADKILIFAVGRVLEFLRQRNIVPDFAVCVDPPSHDPWLEEQCPETVLLTIANVAPGVALKFPNRIWAAGDSLYFNHLAEDLELPFAQIAMAQSSTISAIDFARRFGCSQIALLGNELCLSEDGDSHLNGYLSSNIDRGEEIELTGTNGSKLQSTPGFLKIRKAIEHYLNREFNGKNKNSVFNCATRGVAIKGTEEIDFSDFLSRYASCEKRFSYKNDIDDSSEISKRLRDKLSSILPSNFDNFKANYCDLPEVLSDQVDDLTMEAFTIDSDPTNLKEFRALMASRLALDIESDIENVIEKLIDNPEKMSDESHLNAVKFSAFRSYAIERISINNPEFAKALDNREYKAKHNFEFFLQWIGPHFVSMVQADGENIALSAPYLKMEKEAAKCVNEFITDNNFNPDEHSLITLAPANWLHEIEFAKHSRDKDLDLLVIEPWPELFSELIDFTIFLHKFPKSMTLVGVHHTLAWRKTVRGFIEKTKANGKNIIFWENPYAAALTEIQQIRRFVNESIKT